MEENKNRESNPFDNQLADGQIYTPAMLWKRFANYILDYLCCMALWFGIVVLVLVVAGLLGMEINRLENLELGSLGEAILGAIMYVSYYTFFEGMFGTTPGKLLTHTLLITTEGYRPSLQTAAFRSLWRIVPFEAFTFLFGTTGLHDGRTGTMVIDKKGYVPPFQTNDAP